MGGAQPETETSSSLNPITIANRLFGTDGDVLADSATLVILITTALSVTGVFLVSPIVSDLKGPFGLTDAQAGQIITVYTAPGIVLIPLVGYLADRVGRKPVLVTGLILFGTGGVAVGLVDRFELALALRFVQGIGNACIYPTTITYLGDLYRGTRETTAQGFHSASIQVIGLIAPVVAGGLVLISWRLPFVLFGVAFLLAGWVWIALPAVETRNDVSISKYITDLREQLIRPAMGAILGSFLVRFSLSFAFFAYISVLIVQTTGRTALAAGVTVSAFSLTALASSSQAGRLVDRFDSIPNMVGGFLMMGGGLAMMGSVSSFAAILIGALVFGIGGGITAPVQKSLVTQLSPVSVRAGSVSASGVARGVGQTTGPLLMGVFLQFLAIRSSFVLIGILGAVLGTATMIIAYSYE